MQTLRLKFIIWTQSAHQHSIFEISDVLFITSFTLLPLSNARRMLRNTVVGPSIKFYEQGFWQRKRVAHNFGAAVHGQINSDRWPRVVGG